MLINVPQYIDVEDKVAGPLTAKQLGWMIAMGVLLLILWNVVPGPVFFIIGLPLSLIFIGLAFYKPYGQPLGSFILFGVMYFFRPKVYMWKRNPSRINNIPKVAATKATQVQDKHLTENSLQDLAQMLDSEGMQYSDKLEEILKKVPVKRA